MIKKGILVAVAGITPQIITETLYGLMVLKKIAIEEVFIITTLEGKNEILKDGILLCEIKRMCKKYKKKIPVFTEGNIILAGSEEDKLIDVKFERDNKLFPEVICNFLSLKTTDENIVLHCSLTGGRKTMSVAMATALSLFGRKEDKLYHVLVSKEFEEKKKFFPETEEEKKQLIISEVPYIRLRGLLSKPPGNSYNDFNNLVAEAQDRLENISNSCVCQLIFETEKHCVKIGEKEIKLQPFDFAFYYFVAKSKKPIEAGKLFTDKNKDRLLKFYRKIYRSGETIDIKKVDIVTRITKSASVIKHILREKLGESCAFYYEVRSTGTYGNKKYLIELPWEKRVFH